METLCQSLNVDDPSHALPAESWKGLLVTIGEKYVQERPLVGVICQDDL